MELRANAYVELHAWLAAAARTETALAPAELDEARRRYAVALRADPRDDALSLTTLALGRCETDRCAAEALAGSPFAPPFAAAWPTFLASSWQARAVAAHTGIEAAASVLDPAFEAMTDRVARDLGLAWPDAAPVLVVAGAPPPGPDALIPIALGASGTCFGRRKRERERTRVARVADCALVHATLGLAAQSALFEALTRHTDRSRARRLWSLAAIHAVATTVRSWEPSHESVAWLSARAEEPAALAWLAEHWAARGDVDALASALAAVPLAR